MEILANNFENEIGDYKSLYEYLKSIGFKWATTSNTLRGHIFTLTGDGPIKRDVLTKMIESQGGYVKGASKKTSYLVTNDPNGNSGKTKKAREYGTSIISYEELIEMLG
jgi:NAD-dependent DNA ligase